MNSPFIINLMYFERMKKNENKNKVTCENKKENITSEITENQSDSNKNTNFLNFLTVDNMMKYVNF
jgi:hypothetical protein